MGSTAPASGAALAGFDPAVFISYTHVDNQSFGPDEKEWISHLQAQLAARVQQLFGERLTVWRDDKLQGNDHFPEMLEERLSTTAVLVSVCSPRYLHSEWCLRELNAFIRAAAAGDGIQLGAKSRVFKVVKTPVPVHELPDPLDSLLGYEFFEELSDEQHTREFLLNPDPEARWKFYARVDDLAQDIVALLRELAGTSRQTPEESADGRTVYLAETASDMAQHRDSVKRELERRGHQVLPKRALPLTVEELTAEAEDALSRSELSIHLLGSRYGARPDGDDRSIPHLQLDLAAHRAAREVMSQLIWIPEDVDDPTEAQAALVGGLHGADVGELVEIVQSAPEVFKAHLLDRLEPESATPVAPVAAPTAKRIYLVYDRDDESAAEVRSQLEAAGHVVMIGLSEGTAAEIREVHEMSMVVSDAVLIYYGHATEHWVRMKLFDLIKAPGWGRTEPFQAAAVWLAEPASPQKASYVTNEVMVLEATRESAATAITPFLAQLDAVATGQ